MSRVIKDIMKEACGLSFQTELQRFMELDIKEIAYQTLSMAQINVLAHKINLLPLEYRNILFLRYYFGNTATEIDKILETEYVKGKLLYIQKILSKRIGLDNSWIGNTSMKTACKLALEEDMKVYNKLQATYKPNYSRAFRRKLKDIHNIQNYSGIYKTIVKRIAILILISTIGFTAVLAVNVEAREKIFGWLIETFSEFSIFQQQDTVDETDIDLKSFKINYVPVGFDLIDTNEGESILIYNYLTKDKKELMIKLLISFNKEQSYYNTEGIEIEKITFKDSQAYIWEKSQVTYLVWYQDGTEFHISGDLSKNEIIKVKENIFKNN